MVVQVGLPIYYIACFSRVNGASISVIVSKYMLKYFSNVGIIFIIHVAPIFHVIVVWIIAYLL
jgi:hypothetical protein